MGVIELANEAWLAPALYLALADAEIEADVRDYLSFLHSRNVTRNVRLRAQLVEAATALNNSGIVPIVLKGGIHLCSATEGRLGARIMSDLDLSVAPSQLDRARAALADLGYRDVDGMRGMGRPSDVGLIELRDRPSARAHPYLYPDLTPHTSFVRVERAIVSVPSPTAQALHLIVHDMLKEGDYWRCRLDLRHLYDLAELSRTVPGVDWDEVSARLAGPPARNALQLQLRALAELFAVTFPGRCLGGPMAHLRHSLRMCAAGKSGIGFPVRVAGNIVWGVHRLTTAQTYRWRGSVDFVARAGRALAEAPKGSRL